MKKRRTKNEITRPLFGPGPAKPAPRNREDILKEINSTLMNRIEDRNPQPAEKPSEKTVKEVLRIVLIVVAAFNVIA